MVSKVIIALVILNNLPRLVDTGKENGLTDADNSKVVLRNSIAYHFIKNVRAIEMDLFVTRKIDVSPVLQGINKVQNVRDRILTLCKKIPSAISDAKRNAENAKKAAEPSPPLPKPIFHTLPIAGRYSRTEAAAYCRANNYQLPEVYTAQESYDLTQLMKKYGLPAVHAGIYWDYEYVIHRFMATGLPAWHMWQRRIYSYVPPNFVETSWASVSALNDARFFYMPDGNMGVYYETGAFSEGYQFRRDYRGWNKIVHFLSTSTVICQTKWAGEPIPPREPPKGWTIVHGAVEPSHVNQSLWKRDTELTSPLTTSMLSDSPSNRTTTPLEELCLSVGEHLTEITDRSNYRLTTLLALVDISIDNKVSEHDLIKRDVYQLENDLQDSEIEISRIERGLPSLIFSNGLKSVWTLMGFVDKLHNRRRLKKLEKTVDKQSKAIDQLSQEIASHSISITQLTLVTQDLTRRLQSLTYKVQELEVRISVLDTEVKTQQILQLIDSLIGRTENALSFAFAKLENIIQYALVGQASAFVLPTNRLNEIQDEISKQSPAIIDTAYERMRAIVVSNEEQPTSLLCIINLAAMSRSTKELVQLTPVPWYQKSVALAPVLDHRMVVLDQEAGYYTVVEPSEENGCMTDHCITSNPEVQISAPACGIAQMFDRQLDSCINEDIISNGMFLKRLISDGIIFSVKEEVTAQIFCKSQNSKTQKISGSGIVNLPPGCTIVLTDKAGVTTRIQSLPVSQMLETQSLDLIVNGPQQIFHQSTGSQMNGTSSLTKLINAHLNELSQKLVETTTEVESQHIYVIILSTLLGIVTSLCIATALFLYRYSRRFRRKVNHIRDDVHSRLTEAHKKFITFEQMAARRARDEAEAVPLLPMPRPRRPSRPEPENHLQSIKRRIDELELQVLSIGEDEPAGYLSPLDIDPVRSAAEFYHEMEQPNFRFGDTPPRRFSKPFLFSREDLVEARLTLHEPRPTIAHAKPAMATLTPSSRRKAEGKPTN